jgi:hypothetical protein
LSVNKKRSDGRAWKRLEAHPTAAASPASEVRFGHDPIPKGARGEPARIARQEYPNVAGDFILVNDFRKSRRLLWLGLLFWPILVAIFFLALQGIK